MKGWRGVRVKGGGKRRWESFLGLSILTPRTCCSSIFWNFSSISGSVTGNTVWLYQLAHTLRWQTANKSRWLTSLFSFNFLSNFPFPMESFLSVSSSNNASLSHPLATTSLSTLYPSSHAPNSPGVFLLPFKGAGPVARQSDVPV